MERLDLLEEFWEAHKDKNDIADTSPAAASSEAARQVPQARNAPQRTRSLSDGAALATSNETLPAYHPAWGLPDLLDTFGPLVFPLHRACLLRKRILVVTHVPVAEACNLGKSKSCFCLSKLES